MAPIIGQASYTSLLAAITVLDTAPSSLSQKTSTKRTRLMFGPHYLGTVLRKLHYQNSELTTQCTSVNTRPSSLRDTKRTSLRSCSKLLRLSEETLTSMNSWIMKESQSLVSSTRKSCPLLIRRTTSIELRRSSRGRKCEARRWFWPSGLATVVSITAGSQRVTSKTYRSIYSGRRIR